MTKRYEYKYTIENLSLDSVLNTVRFHPEGFREVYPLRQINNYYLDTADLNLFYQNIDGISKRRKFRYRWYGTYERQKVCTLEIKYKENELGWKDHHRLTLADIETPQKLINHFAGLNLSNGEFFPKLYNCYKRYYFESFDKRFRLTVDFDQKFGTPFHQSQPFIITHEEPAIVMELKFDESHFDALNQITMALPFLRTKNSKYSNGITQLYLR